jgi:hypothetical protein
MDSISEMRERYLRLRRVSTELNDRMTKRLPKAEVEQAAQELGLLRNGTLVLASMDQSNVLFDYCLYNVYRDGRNAVQRFLEECPPAEGSLERLILEAKCRAWYSIFGVARTVSGLGVEADDILRQERHLIADISLSQCDCVGGLMATRVIPFDGFIMTGGAGLPLGGNDMDRDTFSGGLRRVCFDQNITSFRQLTAVQENELTKAIIRNALSSEASSWMRYEDPRPAGGRPPQRREPAMVAATARVGRNERCPCGSGRKFKLCCGRNR